MNVGPAHIRRTSHARGARGVVGIALSLPAFLLAAMLTFPGAASAGGVSGPDLTVSITDSPDPVAPGPSGSVTFTVLVTNVGSDDSFETQLEFSTGGASIDAAQVTGSEGSGCSIEGTTATCSLGFLSGQFGSGAAPAPLLASNEGEATFDVTPPSTSGPFTSTATASSVDQTDQVPADNTDEETTTVSSSGFESASGMVPPGGSITTLDGPLNAADPFAVALKNISTDTLDVTIEEEPCDGTQEGDPLCSVPRVGGVAGDFMFQPMGGGGTLDATSASDSAIVIARLFYDESLLVGVKGTRIFWQKTPGGPVMRLPRCDDGQTTECFRREVKNNGDEIIRTRLTNDPRFTRG